MLHESPQITHQDGFTIVELFVALVLSSLVVIAIYSAYTIQQKTYTAQNQVVEMQQNLRAAMDVMTREIRMAGYDSSATGVASAGIYIADSSNLVFSADYNEDGDVLDDGENIAFALFDNGGINTLGRATSAAPITMPLGGLQPIADNIEQLEFLYTLDDGNRVLDPTNAQLDNIIAVQISVLAVASQRDAKFTLDGNPLYQPASATTAKTIGGVCSSALTANCVSTIDWTPQVGGIRDGLRRRFLTTTINGRNLRM